MSRTIDLTTTEHVEWVSSKDFATTTRDLEAELGKASTGELMNRLASAADWADYAGQCATLAGPSGLIQVGHLDWGAVLTLSGVAMRARCFIVGNPLTAQKLLAAGGPEVGLYLPTKILVFEDSNGVVRVTYDRFRLLLAPRDDAAITRIAEAIDQVLENLAIAATT